MTRRVLDAGLPLQTLLLASYLGVFALPLVVMGLGGALSHELLLEREDELRRTTTLVTRLFEAELCGSNAGTSEPANLERPCVVDWSGPKVAGLIEDVRKATGAGVRVIDHRGIVIATSGPRLGDDLSDREEVQTALRGGIGTTGRTQAVPVVGASRLDLRKEMPVTWAVTTAPLPLAGATTRESGDAARPLQGPGPVGVLLLARPTREASGAMANMARGVGPRGFALLALSILGIGWWSWRLSRSLKSLAIVSNRLDTGPQQDLDVLTQSRVIEVRKLAVAFAAVTERLRARVAYNRDLAATVAHEFKTPLTTLRGVVELLDDRENPLPPEQTAVFLENARTDLDRLSRMVTGLLALARAEARAEERPTPSEGDPPDRVDLDAILAETRCPVTGTVGTVSGEAEGWSMVVRNLVENARTHGAEPVRIEAGPHGFDVVDAGPGISGPTLERVFDRFFTTGNHRQGTGLGLAIVRATIEAYGGTVDAVSVPGETRFRVRTRTA